MLPQGTWGPGRIPAPAGGFLQLQVGVARAVLSTRRAVLLLRAAQGQDALQKPRAAPAMCNFQATPAKACSTSPVKGGGDAGAGDPSRQESLGGCPEV